MGGKWKRPWVLALGAKDGVVVRHSRELRRKKRKESYSLKGHIGFLVLAEDYILRKSIRNLERVLYLCLEGLYLSPMKLSLGLG